ncbi:MAG TPA: ATP-grasp domain-containing protein [Bdellovibrionota bacterium]|nr:ATP-grasp domain-containing protein [Bdellovibrionota bacterium]
MKRNWFAILILSLGLSADALVLVSFLWLILRQGGTGQSLGLAAFLMALVPYLLQQFSARLAGRLSRDPARTYAIVRMLGLGLSLGCALLPQESISLGLLYGISGAYAVLLFLTHQSLETFFSHRVVARALSPRLASRILQTAIMGGGFLGGALSGFVIEAGGLRSVALALAAIYAFGAITFKTVEMLEDEPDGEPKIPGTGVDSPAVWGAFAMIGVVLVQVWAFNILVPYIAGVERGWSARDYGVIDGLSCAGAFLAALAMGGRLSHLSMLGFPALALSYLWLSSSQTVGQASVAGVAVGFFATLIRVKQREILFAATTGSEQAARWAGHLSMIAFLTRALTPLVLGYSLDRIGGTRSLEIVALFLVVSGFTLQLGQALALRFRPVRRRPVVAIVDAYCSSALLAPELKARGYDCIHIMSSTELSPVFYASLKDEEFVDHVLYQGNLGETVAELRRHRVKHVVAGWESGIELADALSERMGLRTNGTPLSRARRDKHAMLETARAQGLQCPRQALVTTADAALAFARAHGSFPVVLKPLSSSGHDGVRICATEDELHEAARSLLGSRTRYGRFNDEILVQAHVDGEEYSVDTLSVEGHHRVTAVWRHERGTITLLDPLSPVAREAALRARLALGALAIQNGPTHQQLMLSAEGWVFLELGARLGDPGLPELWQDCTGYKLPALWASALLDRRSFLRLPEPIGRLERQGRSVLLAAPVDHCILDPGALGALRSLESFSRLELTRKPSDVFGRTRDRFTSVGQVHLVHRDSAVVERDLGLVRQLEASGLYIEVSAPREQFGYSVLRRPQLVSVKAPVERKAELEGT